MTEETQTTGKGGEELPELKPSAWIKELRFNSGDELEFLPHSKVLIVGANNSGKSRTLREIFERISYGQHHVGLAVIDDIVLGKAGQPLLAHLQKNAVLNGDNYQLGDWNLNRHMVSHWESPYLTSGIAAGFLRNVTARDRLAICDQQPSIGPTDMKSRPQHVLYDDEALMKRISDLFRNSFAKDLMFDFRGGNKLPIHVGTIPDPERYPDRVSDAYVKLVRDQPLLDQQGDGMKSYAGILFETVVSGRDMNLVDEPEAFLHPPQMRRLGKALAKEVAGQLFVATHSSDILRGFLDGATGRKDNPASDQPKLGAENETTTEGDSASADVRILRIQRDGNVNRIFEAPTEALKKLWESPALRYSNALEGIFHEQAILCEDDSDCRLLNSIADYLDGADASRWPDTAYVPTGGKDAIPKIAPVLRQIGVPVKAVFDFDFLSSEKLVKETVEAFGGDWIQIKSDWHGLAQAITNGKGAKSTPEIKNAVRKILDTSPDDRSLPKSSIEDELKQSSPWANAKRHGESAVGRGTPWKHYEKVRDWLNALGIYFVPGGEMESFSRSIGGHGPAFVTTLLTQIPLDAPELGGLREFVERVHKGAHAPLKSAGTIEQRKLRQDAKEIVNGQAPEPSDSAHL